MDTCEDNVSNGNGKNGVPLMSSKGAVMDKDIYGDVNADDGQYVDSIAAGVEEDEDDVDGADDNVHSFDVGTGNGRSKYSASAAFLNDVIDQVTNI